MEDHFGWQWVESLRKKGRPPPLSPPLELNKIFFSKGSAKKLEILKSFIELQHPINKEPI